MVYLFLYPHCSDKPVLFDPVLRPPTLTFNHGDLILTPDMEFCQTRPEPFVALVKLTPCLAAVFNILPPASVDLNVFSFGEARREIVSSVQLELASLPDVKTMTNEDLRTVAQPMSHYYTTISPSTSRALADYMPMRIAFSLACVSLTISLFSFSISFTLFLRQLQRFFQRPQRFFRGTHGQFKHIVSILNDDDNDVTAAFLYMTDAEFFAIKGLTREVFARSDTEITSCVPPPSPFYPDISHVYTSASMSVIYRCPVTGIFSLFRHFGTETFSFVCFSSPVFFHREP